MLAALGKVWVHFTFLRFIPPFGDDFQPHWKCGGGCSTLFTWDKVALGAPMGLPPEQSDISLNNMATVIPSPTIRGSERE